MAYGTGRTNGGCMGTIQVEATYFILWGPVLVDAQFEKVWPWGKWRPPLAPTSFHFLLLPIALPKNMHEKSI